MTMSKPNQVTKETFLKNVAQHELTIVKDDGVHRHIRMSKPNSSDRHYDIVTYPNYLVYSGDMGCYVFSRLTDMFRFFRNDDADWGVNLFYWEEKIQSADRDKVKEFSFDVFKANIIEHGIDDEDAEAEAKKEWLLGELEYTEEDEFGSVEFIRNFDGNNEFNINLDDFWERDNTVYTSRYIWCCHAIVWAIRQYDLVKSEAVAA
jgi:predicted  nucleic acid-binding Zn-ribbon protein